jgi:hypothetical protein
LLAASYSAFGKVHPIYDKVPATKRSYTVSGFSARTDLLPADGEEVHGTIRDSVDSSEIEVPYQVGHEGTIPPAFGGMTLALNLIYFILFISASAVSFYQLLRPMPPPQIKPGFGSSKLHNSGMNG